MSTPEEQIRDIKAEAKSRGLDRGLLDLYERIKTWLVLIQNKHNSYVPDFFELQSYKDRPLQVEFILFGVKFRVFAEDKFEDAKITLFLDGNEVFEVLVDRVEHGYKVTDILLWKKRTDPLVAALDRFIKWSAGETQNFKQKLKRDYMEDQKKKFDLE